MDGKRKTNNDCKYRHGALAPKIVKGFLMFRGC